MNYYAVLLAAVSSFMLGGLWYGIDAMKAGAVIFAADVERLARFYGELADMMVTHREAGLLVLDGTAMQLVIHALPPAPPAGAASPRRDAWIKLFFPVASLDTVRMRAPALGGHIAPPDQQWEARGFRAAEGVDPEGNLVQCREPVA
jgi:predicted enzyme related to lactoylglutathione lyase